MHSTEGLDAGHGLREVHPARRSGGMHHIILAGTQASFEAKSESSGELPAEPDEASDRMPAPIGGDTLGRIRGHVGREHVGRRTCLERDLASLVEVAPHGELALVDIARAVALGSAVCDGASHREVPRALRRVVLHAQSELGRDERSRHRPNGDEQSDLGHHRKRRMRRGRSLLELGHSIVDLTDLGLERCDTPFDLGQPTVDLADLGFELLLGGEVLSTETHDLVPQDIELRAGDGALREEVTQTSELVDEQPLGDHEASLRAVARERDAKVGVVTRARPPTRPPDLPGISGILGADDVGHRLLRLRTVVFRCRAQVQLLLSHLEATRARHLRARRRTQLLYLVRRSGGSEEGRDENEAHGNDLLEHEVSIWAFNPLF